MNLLALETNEGIKIALNPDEISHILPDGVMGHIQSLVILRSGVKLIIREKISELVEMIESF